MRVLDSFFGNYWVHKKLYLHFRIGGTLTSRTGGTLKKNEDGDEYNSRQYNLIAQHFPAFLGTQK